MVIWSTQVGSCYPENILHTSVDWRIPVLQHSLERKPHFINDCSLTIEARLFSNWEVHATVQEAHGLTEESRGCFPTGTEMTGV